MAAVPACSCYVTERRARRRAVTAASRAVRAPWPLSLSARRSLGLARESAGSSAAECTVGCGTAGHRYCTAPCSRQRPTPVPASPFTVMRERARAGAQAQAVTVPVSRPQSGPTSRARPPLRSQAVSTVSLSLVAGQAGRGVRRRPGRWRV